MLNIVVLVSGGGTNLQALIDAISDGRIKDARIARVISSKPGVFALERAQKAGIEGVCVSKKDYPGEEAFADALLSAIEEAGADLIVLAGYLVVLPVKITEKYAMRIVNIHPSLIPSFCGKGYYGLKVHEEALARGVKVTGATVHFVDGGCDTGPIILQKAVEIKTGDTAEVLQKRVMEEAEWVLLPKAVDLIAHGKVRVKDGIVEIDD